MLLDDGTHRYMTVREAARVMTFPDSWTLPDHGGSRCGSSATRSLSCWRRRSQRRWPRRYAIQQKVIRYISERLNPGDYRLEGGSAIHACLESRPRHVPCARAG